MTLGYSRILFRSLELKRDLNVQCNMYPQMLLLHSFIFTETSYLLTNLANNIGTVHKQTLERNFELFLVVVVYNSLHVSIL